jgi:hypothetical protein
MLLPHGHETDGLRKIKISVISTYRAINITTAALTLPHSVCLSVCLSVPFAVRVLLELSCQRFWRRRRRRRRRREDVTHMIIPTVPVFDRKEVCLDYNVSFLSRFKKKNRHFCVKFMSVLLRSAFKSKYSKSVNLFEYTEYAATLHIWRPSPASGTRWRVM